MSKSSASYQSLDSWELDGDYITYGALQHNVFVKHFGDYTAKAQKTLVLIHGFPESSYSYHKVVEGLLKTFDRIVLFDLIGYGFSDKPKQDFSYSLFDQSDSVFAVLKHFNIKGCHVLSHDMGNSISTEFIARHENSLLPGWFSDGLQSVTFTNGSIVMKLSKLRITQKILLTRFGFLLSKMTFFKLFKHQITSAQGNSNLSEQDVKNLWFANRLQDGNKLFYKTIRYINDRRQYENTRWIPALRHTNLPIHLCWGEDDAVAKIEMAHYLKDEICQNATLTIMKGVGHFCQLDNSVIWIKSVSEFYFNLAKYRNKNTPK